MRMKVVSGAAARRPWLLGVLSIVAVAALASGTLAQAGTSKQAGSVVVKTASVGKLGTILVNSQGHTLYMFVPDKQSKVTCVSSCAIAWPPLKIAAGAKAVAQGSAKSSLLGSDQDPAGGWVVTYNKWPLYTWLGDKKAGQTLGQAINNSGGYWYVISPSGTLIKTKVAATTGTTTTTTKKSGGGGGANADGCPAGQTIMTAGSNDQDADNFGGSDDFDGCL